VHLAQIAHADAAAVVVGAKTPPFSLSLLSHMKRGLERARRQVHVHIIKTLHLRELDMDGNGAIDVAEVREALEHVRLIQTGEQAEGDATMYSAAHLLERYRNRQHAGVVAELEHWWSLMRATFDNDGSQTLDRAEYMELHRRLLYAFALDDDDENDLTPAQQLAALEDDWMQDSEGQDTVDKARFCDAMFSLADVWTETTDAMEYIEFLRQVRGLVFRHGEGRGERGGASSEWGRGRNATHQKFALRKGLLAARFTAGVCGGFQHPSRTAASEASLAQAQPSHAPRAHWSEELEYQVTEQNVTMTHHGFAQQGTAVDVDRASDVSLTQPSNDPLGRAFVLEDQVAEQNMPLVRCGLVPRALQGGAFLPFGPTPTTAEELLEKWGQHGFAVPRSADSFANAYKYGADPTEWPVQHKVPSRMAKPPPVIDRQSCPVPWPGGGGGAPGARGYGILPRALSMAARDARMPSSPIRNAAVGMVMTSSVVADRDSNMLLSRSATGSATT
jgi:hypothetical protein